MLIRQLADSMIFRICIFYRVIYVFIFLLRPGKTFGIVVIYFDKLNKLNIC
jgi:hypothetical protein